MFKRVVLGLHHLAGRQSNANPRQIVLYGKPGCHLCEDALQLIHGLSRGHSFELTEIDIRSDPALFRRYDVRIPVIVIDGQTELEAPICESDLRAALSRRR